MLRLLSSCALLALGAIGPAHGQVGEAQRLVWQCGEAAGERGLSGPARDAFIQRCVNGDTPRAGSGRGSRERDAGNAPPASGASAWRLSAPSAAQWTLAIPSSDRTFGFSLDCVSSTGRGTAPTTFFTLPRGWYFSGDTTTVLIDGQPRRLEVGGSEGGVSLTDTVQDGVATLSPETRRLLASGRRMEVQGLVNGRRTRTAVFDIAGGQALFADFERRCRRAR